MKLLPISFKVAFVFLIAINLNACKSTDIKTLLSEATSASLRSDQNKLRDPFRHPKQTLNFFGLKPNMTVVEIWPGSGWYSEILAPILKEQGKYYAANFPSDSEVKYYQRALQSYKDKLAGNKIYSEVKLSEFYPGTHHAIAPKESADMVLTFRNLHNWYMQRDDEGVENAFKAFYSALKPGGILGIVDHRLPEIRHSAKAKRSGYVKESWVISLAQKSGFKLVSKSEINANSKDTADHAKGVWTLPPRLALGETDTNKYIAIGESDRMTLKFKKP
ncbi:class I SAM-dependent methyltransferase [Pseudoalteromonas denitrificans]|uniref:Predicted methyltransferase n=1 Tax=Pseudoalteromonas denitrificans DSM 6059 TaxID=1123010 RepID=A0A1I1J6M6_9GAMM|nr:class I SAM-dependent methyltransferase [Pseudoalteromonas denitrificans]SFC43781.1 Predicted methyltransferase [Pseudoalteromonas denitrificans DSM 6059]